MKMLYDHKKPPMILDDDPAAAPADECSACGLNFITGQEIHLYEDVMRGNQVVCEVCYMTYCPSKEENQNANIRTMLILREIRKSR